MPPQSVMNHSALTNADIQRRQHAKQAERQRHQMAMFANVHDAQYVNQGEPLAVATLPVSTQQVVTAQVPTWPTGNCQYGSGYDTFNCPMGPPMQQWPDIRVVDTEAVGMPQTMPWLNDDPSKPSWSKGAAMADEMLSYFGNPTDAKPSSKNRESSAAFARRQAELVMSER